MDMDMERGMNQVFKYILYRLLRVLFYLKQKDESTILNKLLDVVSGAVESNLKISYLM